MAVHGFGEVAEPLCRGAGGGGHDGQVGDGVTGCGAQFGAGVGECAGTAVGVCAGFGGALGAGFGDTTGFAAGFGTGFGFGVGVGVAPESACLVACWLARASIAAGSSGFESAVFHWIASGQDVWKLPCGVTIAQRSLRQAVCTSVASNLPVTALHSFTMPSAPPEASMVASGLSARQSTQSS